MVQVKNNEIIQFHLPNSGYLKSGESVSGYYLLPEEVLRAEGWLPLEDIEPEYDEATHYLVRDGYEILEDKVVALYRIEERPPEPVDEVAELRALVDALIGGGDEL